MAAETRPVYIVTVGGGKVLTNTHDAHGALDCVPKGTEDEKWMIEAGDEPNVIAIKSCVGGQYLRNNGPLHVASGAKIGLGEKQWWTLEKGRNPHSVKIRSNASTAALPSYLNDFEGVYRDNNPVHMWQLQGWEVHQWWLDWYIVDAVSTDFKPLQAIAGRAGGDGEKQTAREKELAEREQKVKEAEEKVKGIEDREAALKKREEELAEKEKAATSKPALAASEPSKSDGDADKREKALDEREAALKRREEELAKNEKATADKPAPSGQAALQSAKSNGDADNRAKALDEREAALKKQSQKLADQEADLKKRSSQPSLPQAKPAQQQPKFTPATTSANSDELERLKREIELLQLWRENDRLKCQLKVEDLEDQLNNAQKSNAKLRGNGAKMCCGQNAYPPPRKIERKVTGIHYEGLEGPNTKAGKACGINGHHHK